MKKALLFIFTFCYFLSFSQNIYNPQYLYDSPGGLFDKDSLRDIYVNFQDPNYHNYLVNSWYYNPDERIPAIVTLNGVVHDSVGVRYKGNSTFCLPNDNGNPKVPFNIDMNYWISGQKLLDYKKIKLANAWMDPTFAKEFTAAKIYRKYLPCPEINLTKLHVQGNYLGVYVNTESINKQFLDKHFDEKSGPLFKCDDIDRFCDTAGAPNPLDPDLKYLGNDSTLYYNSYDIKSDYGWEELLDFIDTLNNHFNEIDSVLNVDRVLWYFAVNSVISNLDTYNGYYIHNYYLYQTGDGLFQIIPWDLDNSFLGAILGFTSPTTLYQRDPYYTGTLGDRPLAYTLLNNPFYRKQYTAHLRTIINESMDTSVIRGGINTLQSLAHNAVDSDQYKQYTTAEYYDNAENHIGFWWRNGGIMETIDGRKAYLLSHPEISLIPPTINNVAINNSLVTAEVVNANIVELMATKSNYNSKFQSFTMLDDGLNGDMMAGDGIFTTTLPFQGSGNDVKFYIRAENNDAMKLNPERAEYEFYIYCIPHASFDTLITVTSILWNGMNLTTSGDYTFLLTNSVNCDSIAHLNLIIENTSAIVPISNNKSKTLLKITNVLGEPTKPTSNTPLFYIYDDGTVEKKLILE